MPVTKLTHVETVPSYAVIIRCIHCRGRDQRDALAELKRRGLWLTEKQAEQAGVTREQAGLPRRPLRAGGS